jgi:hypothetical protein
MLLSAIAGVTTLVGPVVKANPAWLAWRRQDLSTRRNPDENRTFDGKQQVTPDFGVVAGSRMRRSFLESLTGLGTCLGQ